MTGGGAERVFTHLLRHLDRRRFSLCLALLDKQGPFLEALPPDVEVIDLKVKRARYSFKAIIRTVRQQRPDVVFSTIGHMNMTLMLCKPFLPRGIHYIARETLVPGVYMKHFGAPWYYGHLYRLLYPRFDAIVCQSRDMQQDMVATFTIPLEKTVLLHNPVDVQAIREQAAASPPPLSDARRNLLAMGRLVPRKGFDLLLRAVQKLDDPECHLTLLGEGKCRSELEELAQELGIEKRVTFAGFQQNPAPYLAGADVFVLSSLYEGFPNVVLEAMACGTPVAAFACPGGLNELVIPGENGCLAAVRDVSGLAACIRRLLAAPLSGEAVRESVATRFGLEAIVQGYEKLFTTVCGEEDGNPGV